MFRLDWLNAQISVNQFVIILWIILTAININKAFHIDDTFHLLAAEWVAEKPTDPMAAKINWSDQPEAIFLGSQPPLYFYLIAFFIKIFGTGEIGLHLLTAIFLFLVLYFYAKILREINVKQPKVLLTLFAFCPALIVNQNLMIDIPILSMALGCTFYLIIAQQSGKLSNYLSATLFLTFGLMMKFTLLPFLVVIGLTAILSGHYKALISLIIPLAIMIGWSSWSELQYGVSHLGIKTNFGFSTNKLLGFLGTTGAISTFVVIPFYTCFKSQFTKWLIVDVLAILIICLPPVYFDIINQQKFSAFLNYIFIASGSLVLLLFMWQTAKLKFSYQLNFIRHHMLIITLIIFGLAAFIVLFAPINATRHSLLLIPFFIILFHKEIDASVGPILNITLAVTIFLGVALGVSDWLYADFYRNAAEEISVKKQPDQKVYAAGHWGWQWYAYQNGWEIYATNGDHKIRKDDIILIPKNASKQHIDKALKLDTIDFYTEKPNLLTFFSGKSYASMYTTFGDKPAWNLSTQPIDTIFICKVNQPITADQED
ncbi:hypothetical protein GCM10027429_17360 [Marivirga atlantica]|jgi:hypothetical protein|uniref:Glycosyltransferase family 39 protein n=1 Tax=Marivirga atlantica TaxID=1548457 RepID=A0A937A7U9_9BACT|nr:glycosyltransferase family 39 protein [Marivirga atlantica]MBL0765352.1 glycosyltransferase family 39 protein [Marivirga atlantica]